MKAEDLSGGAKVPRFNEMPCAPPSSDRLIMDDARKMLGLLKRREPLKIE
jgi:hypothetical protein